MHTLIFSSQILDLLLDVNNSGQIPVDKRIDLTTVTPSLSAIPSLISDNDLSQSSELQSPAGRKIYHEIRDMIAERAASQATLAPAKSLATLMASTPHLSSSSPQLPKGLLDSLIPDDGQAAPYTYITPDQLDDYIYDVDASLGTVPPVPRSSKDMTQDLAFGHFHSPYNWLRRHVPQIFLQDGEGSEKSHGKPGALRGAGKRASMPAPSKPDALEIVEEDGIGYDFSLGGPVAAKGKRKRDEDDTGYHPKKGASDAKKPRQARKKKSDGVDEKPPTSRRKKPKPGTSPPPMRNSIESV